jgi:hypothetical protein
VVTGGANHAAAAISSRNNQPAPPRELMEVPSDDKDLLFEPI